MTEVRLRKSQLKVLRALAKAKVPLTKIQVAKKADTDYAGLTWAIGSRDEGKRLENDGRHFPSLLTLRYVRYGAKEQEGPGVPTYEITAAGRRALESTAG